MNSIYSMQAFSWLTQPCNACLLHISLSLYSSLIGVLLCSNINVVLMMYPLLFSNVKMMSGQWSHKCAHIVMSPWDIDSAALWIVILTLLFM